MTLTFVDTSALLRAYLADEEDHRQLGERILGSDAPTVASELCRVEFASTLRRAARKERLTSETASAILEAFDSDCSYTGPIALLALDPGPCLSRARELVLDHDLGSLDAIHLAVADLLRRGESDEVEFCTRDERQGLAARSIGFALV